MDWGAWEGARAAELRAEAPDELAANEARGLDLRPPGGESPREVCGRLRALRADLASDPTPVVAVCHKGVIRAALALATGWDMRTAPPLRLARDQALALVCEPGWPAAAGAAAAAARGLSDAGPVLGPAPARHRASKRAATVARALVDRGLEVTLVERRTAGAVARAGWRRAGPAALGARPRSRLLGAGRRRRTGRSTTPCAAARRAAPPDAVRGARGPRS